MAKEVIDLLALKVRGILRILHMPEVDDGEMRELTFRLGQTSKWERIRLNDCATFFGCAIAKHSPNQPLIPQF